MNTLSAFNRCVELHSNIQTRPNDHTVQSINDFDNYTVDVAESLIAVACDGDTSMIDRQAALARLRVIAEIRLDVQEVLVRKAFGMGYLSHCSLVH